MRKVPAVGKVTSTASRPGYPIGSRCRCEELPTSGRHADPAQHDQSGGGGTAFRQPRAIDFHLRNVLAKLQVTSRAELMRQRLGPSTTVPPRHKPGDLAGASSSGPLLSSCHAFEVPAGHPARATRDHQGLELSTVVKVEAHGGPLRLSVCLDHNGRDCPEPDSPLEESDLRR